MVAGAAGDAFEFALHGANEFMRGSGAIGEGAELENVAVDVSERFGIQGEETQRMREEFGEGFRAKRDGADDQIGLEGLDGSDVVDVPAVAEFREMRDGCDGWAPFADTDERFLGADGAEDGGGAGSKGDDARRGAGGRHNGK